ncbi:MAG: glycoside hydrolase family 65 protein [Brevundimonas sp.]|nr:MAG: glycoside hydrolase family 65 protein [Brevundimonas sp.]
MSSPISPPVARGARDGALPAYVSNGMIGLRVREQPLQAGMTLVSGLAGEHWERRVEAAAPAPYPLAGDIGINGVWLSDQPSTVSNLVQSYDFATAELTSAFRFTAGGRVADISVVTFANRDAPSLVQQEVRIEVDGACDLGLRAVVETAGLRGRVVRRRMDTPGEPEPACDGSLLWETDGALSQCGYALVTELLGEGAPDAPTRTLWDRSGPLVSAYAVRARAGRPVRLRQIAAVVPSVLHDRPDEEAVRRVARGKATGFDELRRRNRAIWADLWKGRIIVHGARPEHQALIDAAIFYLNSSSHPGTPAATSIFGLATWHDYTYYFGHVMWDVDAFCVPPLILLQPDAARAMLEFRSRGLDAARGIARLSGRVGLQFPWEAAPLSGQEASPGGGDGAAHEDHGSLHTARAFALYADATGDAVFLDEKAWPVLSGVADWLVSRVTRTERGFEFLRATGPAEVPEPPDNDAFTVMAAIQVLRRAVRAAEQTGRDAPRQWSAVAEALYVPIRADQVIAAHDGFRVSEPKGATPSPLAGLFPYDYPASDTVRRSTLDFYLKHWGEYVGAPMFPAFYTTWAAMAGDRDLALHLFEEGYARYDHGRFHQCLEYRPDHPDSEVAAGPFFANLSGMLLGLLMGLTGIVIGDDDPTTWPSRPIILPTGWTAIEVERVWIRGKPVRLRAENGADRATLLA